MGIKLIKFKKYFLLNFFIFLSNISLAEDIYIEKNNFSLTSPDGWVVEKFNIGPMILRIGVASEAGVANCNVTITQKEEIKEDQEEIDNNLNSRAISKNEVQIIKNDLMSYGFLLKNIYPDFLEISGKKTRAVFYMANTKLDESNNFSVEGFNAFYRRKKDLVGITCLGIGKDMLGAKKIFEGHIKEFESITRSINLN